MQVEDERRHADQYKEQVRKGKEQDDDASRLRAALLSKDTHAQ